MKPNLTIVAALMLALLPALARSADQGSEDQLIAVLTSNAPQDQKVSACRQLAAVGTPKSIPALAGLLADEKLSHMACYALLTLDDPAVDEALRSALGKARGRTLAGVVTSLGVRRDAKSVEPIAALLKDADADVAQAAARALGAIGTEPCAKAIESALGSVAEAVRPSCCEGLLRCAESLQKTGNIEAARGIYDRLQAQARPIQVRSAAIRGELVFRGPVAFATLKRYLNETDPTIFTAAVAATRELKGEGFTAVLAESLSSLPADRQFLVFSALGRRQDPTAVASVAALAKKAEKPARLMAIRTLAEIGSPAALPVLRELMGDGDREVAELAQESLASLAGAQVDAAVLAMLDSDKAADRAAGIELIGRRRMRDTAPQLLKAATDADAQVRNAAVKRIGEMLTPADLPTVVDLYLKSAADAQGSAEQAILSICQRAEKPETCASKLVEALGKADAPRKAGLLRILGALGGPDALAAVRSALSDENADLRSTAIRTLSGWKSPEPANDLLKLAQSNAQGGEKLLALRGVLGFAGRRDLAPAARLALCRDSAALVQRPDEKRMLLGALSELESADAIPLIVPHLSDDAIRQEAATAIVRVSERLLKSPQAAKLAGQLIEPLKKVAESGVNADTVKKAKSLLADAERAAKK